MKSASLILEDVPVDRGEAERAEPERRKIDRQMREKEKSSRIAATRNPDLVPPTPWADIDHLGVARIGTHARSILAKQIRLNVDALRSEGLRAGLCLTLVHFFLHLN
jgi:hypothetical protein